MTGPFGGAGSPGKDQWSDHHLLPGGGNLVHFAVYKTYIGFYPTASVRIDKPKMAIGEYGVISLDIDTEGNMIGLHSMQ